MKNLWLVIFLKLLVKIELNLKYIYCMYPMLIWLLKIQASSCIYNEVIGGRKWPKLLGEKHPFTTPKAWSSGEVALFFEKRDITLLKNYRYIIVLSHAYKLFSRVVTNRLALRFDAFQPLEQAGFRRGYSTMDRIHTVRKIIQKSEKYITSRCVWHL